MENLPRGLEEEEEQLILVLAYSRSFITLCQMTADEEFHQKIAKWYQETAVKL